jgi:pseudouridine-5'-phosphate glycosidase
MADSEAGSPGGLFISQPVQRALKSNSAIVALESAVITHGLPFPLNQEAALQMESTITAEGATAATVAVIGGRIHVGLNHAEIETLARPGPNSKIGVRDFASAALNKTSGGTTVAATMFAASKAGIRVFATGGIGGVHRESPFDISADLDALARTPMIVVCAGAKSILDLGATLELLETRSVPVLGFGTDEFPAFYSRTSGLGVTTRLDSPKAICEYWLAHRALSMPSAVLVVNPVPEESAIPLRESESWVAQASNEATERGIRGQALTPFLLRRLGELSESRSLDANLALLINNAQLSARTAVALEDLEKAMEGLS